MSSRDDLDCDNAPAKNSRQAQENSKRPITIACGLFLFLATAAVVVWQNSRLAVLWDVSYVLENAFRISLGQVPYRDFPFPYAPLTFLVQAAIIKLTGHIFWHTIVYTAIVGGAGTFLTWRIAGNRLDNSVRQARLLSFLLSLPLVVLGIYCIFPHPFYDPDCTFAILIGVILLQLAERKPASSLLPVVAGISLVIPLFVKQNTGLAFVLSGLAGMIVLMLIEGFRRATVRRYLITLVAALTTLAIAIMLIHFTAGLKNYWHWTIQFAAERRTPARTEMLGIYKGKPLLLSLLIAAIGIASAWFLRKRSRWLTALCGLIVAAPFAWPAIYLLLDRDPSERAERLLNLWPLVLIVSFVLALITIRKRRGLNLILPFVLIATINGAFMSQQLWGSTYAIWPLFVILLCDMVASFSVIFKNSSGLFLLPAAAVMVLSLLISGAFYVRSHERLTYANLDEGALTKSSLLPLKGMATRGAWLPNFEELIRYTDTNIPRDEPILIIPGEDLFYYTTGRRPQFPVLLFDHTVNPYSPEEILKLARERNIRWVIIKQDLQDEDEQLERERDRLTEALEEEFEQVESLKNYDVYKRIEGNESDEDK